MFLQMEIFGGVVFQQKLALPEETSSRECLQTVWEVSELREGGCKGRGKKKSEERRRIKREKGGN